MKNRNIIVFGASGLLGSEILIGLLNDGAKVVACDLFPEKISIPEKYKDKVILERIDIRDEDSIERIFENHQLIDGIVNCVYPRNKNYGTKFTEVSLADFNENVSLNIGSAFFITQLAAKHFIRTKRPLSLINISSIYGVITPDFQIYAETEMTMPVEYAVIKSAMLHLNKYAAKYIANSNFRVNSVSPGGILDSQPESFIKNYKKHTFGKGMLSAKDVYGSIKYLLSDDSNYVNGQNIIIDDGFHL